MLSIRGAAKELGVAYPSLSSLLKEATGAGLEFEERIAELRYRNDITAMRADARAWAELHPEEPEIELDTAQRVYELAEKLVPPASIERANRVVRELAAKDGRILDSEIVARLRGDPLPDGTVVADSGGSALDDLGGGKGSSTGRRTKKI